MIELKLPWPPSMNRYWRNVKGRTLISEHGRKYKQQVKWMARLQLDEQGAQAMGDQRLKLTVAAYPPDRRRRDLDNILKAVQDALEGVVYGDDSQIDQLHVFRHESRLGGEIELLIEACDA